MRRLFLAGLAAAAAALAAAPAAPAALRNPVMPQTAAGDDSPDPWLFRHAGRYRLTTTTKARIELRSARTLAGLAAAAPKRLWSARGEPAERASELWAPEVHRLGRRWYVYYTAKGATEGFVHRMYVLQSAGDDPEGPYRFKAQLQVPQPYAIDATVATIAGRTYLVYSGGASFTPASLYLAPLSNPWTVAGTPVEISRPTQVWETATFAINEGPEVLVRGGKVHVIYSASWCGTGAYALGRLTVPASANLLDAGTWARAKHPAPVFAKAPGRGIFGPGHGSFFTSPDGRESWMAYHATEDDRGCFTGGLRTTRVQRFTWRRDGTPDFGTPVSLTADVPEPGGEPGAAAQVTGGAAVRDRRLAGYRGARLAAGGRATVRLRVPRAGRYAVRVRVLGGPRAGDVTATLPGGRSVTRSARRAAEQAVELDAGTVTLPRGRAVVRLRAGRGVVADQVRLERAGA